MFFSLLTQAVMNFGTIRKKGTRSSGLSKKRNYHIFMIPKLAKRCNFVISLVHFLKDMTVENEFECQNCGAGVKFKPGTDSQECPFCGTLNEIVAGEPEEVEELDFEEYLRNARAREDTSEIIVVACGTCGAEITLEKNVTFDECPFCARAIHAEAHSKKAIKPKSLLPFRTTEKESIAEFGRWVKRLWFAPNKLKHFAKIGKINGIYLIQINICRASGWRATRLGLKMVSRMPGRR
jgi:predicted RNA-binding Zn-ribbon protein involved in translation (DUF1610 family)